MLKTCKIKNCKEIIFHRSLKKGFCIKHYFEDIRERQVQLFLRKPILDVQRERRANIIKDISLARLKVKGMTANEF